MSNVANRTIFIRDNLDVMRGINSASVDLIYLDPPFNSKRMFEISHRQPGGRRFIQGRLDVGRCERGMGHLD